MEKPWTIITALIGIFIAGAVFGGFFTLRSSARRMQQPVAQLPPTDQPRPQVAGPQLATPAVAQPKPNPITPQLMRQFSKNLRLTPEQQKTIQPIVSRAGEDFQRLREEEARRRQENLADVARVNERMYADVSGLLTPEQRAELQEMRQRIEDRIQAEKQKRAEAAAAEAQNRANTKAERVGPKAENPK